MASATSHHLLVAAVGVTETANLTLAQQTMQRIRSDILEGVLAPGASLKMAPLRDAYQVGFSPLREALFQLSSEGLVSTINRRGFKVAEMSAKEIVEVTRLRQWLERMAIRESFANGDAAWEATVVAAFHLLSVTGAGKGDFDEPHRAFHEALVSACDSPTLHRFRRYLFDVNRRYRKLAWKLGANWHDDIAEHEQILQAALSRDSERAARLMDGHFETIVRMVIKVLPLDDAPTTPSPRDVAGGRPRTPIPPKPTFARQKPPR